MGVFSVCPGTMVDGLGRCDKCGAPIHSSGGTCGRLIPEELPPPLVGFTGPTAKTHNAAYTQGYNDALEEAANHYDVPIDHVGNVGSVIGDELRSRKKTQDKDKEGSRSG